LRQNNNYLRLLLTTTTTTTTNDDNNNSNNEYVIRSPVSNSSSSSSMALQPSWALTAFFQFPNLYTVVRTPWTSDQHVAKPLPTQGIRNTE
jgi:hypothetical protein